MFRFLSVIHIRALIRCRRASHLIGLSLILCCGGPACALEIVQIGPPIERELPTPRLSGDGAVVVGSNGLERALVDGQAAMWLRDSGLRNLGTLPGHDVSFAQDISADGSVIVGRSHELEGFAITSSETFLWTEADGITGLGFYGGGAISADGSTIVGGTTGSDTEAFYWTKEKGVVRLGVPSGAHESLAQDVSANGNAIAVRAWENNPSGTSLRTTAVVWTAAEGFHDLGPLPTGWQSTFPSQISNDGKVLFGVGGPEGSPMKPFLWSQEKGFVPLPIAEGAAFEALRMTSDASLVVGNHVSGSAPNLMRVPFVWDANHGTRELGQVLMDDHGLVDTFFDRVIDISADGTTLLVTKGPTLDQLWAVYLDRPLVAGVPEPAPACLMLCALFGASFLRRSPADAKSRRKVGPNRTPGRRNFRFENLEERSVLSATFGSALSIGNDFGSSMATDVVTDLAGNSYVSGTFSGTVDFDLSNLRPDDVDIVTARGSADAFVAKYAPDDSLIWVQVLGGDAVSGELTDIARKISVDVGGTVYVAGEFVESADFGATTLTSVGDDDGFVAKLDAGGNVLWARRWGNAAADSAQGVDVDSAGNVYALGHRLGDAYDIMKFSPSGAALWSKTVVDRSMLTTADLAVNAAGNVYVAGSFDGTVDFDPSAKTKYVSSGPARAGFVLKLDTNGKFGWVSPFVGKRVGSTNGSSGAMSITLDGSGSIIVGGTFTGTVDFNPGGGTNNLSTQSGGFITKLNSSGALAWARALQGNAPTFVRGLETDAAGNIYATGGFSGTVDLDPGAGAYSRTTVGQGDIYVMKLTSAGNFVWAESFGGTGNDVSFAIAVDLAGDVHLAGYYRTPFDVDPDPLSEFTLPGDGAFNRGFRLRLRQI